VLPMSSPARTVALVVLMAVLLLAMVANWLSVSPTRIYACSCVPPGTPTEELAESAAVFSATAVDITDVSAWKGPLISGTDPVKVTFRVDTVWKGTVQQALTATTARSSASCGYEFERGRKYLVYARGNESELEVSLCSRTSPIERAAEDLEELGTGRAPASGSEPEKNGGRLSFGCNAPLFLSRATTDLSLAVILVGLLGLRLRRRHW
jgi:hypothetical protein